MTGKNRAIDLSFFHKWRDIREGFSLIELNIESHWGDWDHNPQYILFLAIANVVIIDFNWYNIHHVTEDDPRWASWVDHQKHEPPSSNG